METGERIETEFKQQLLQLCAGDKRRFLMLKDEYYNIIDELKEAEQAERKTRRQYYILGRLVRLLCYRLSFYFFCGII